MSRLWVFSLLLVLLTGCAFRPAPTPFPPTGSEAKKDLNVQLLSATVTSSHTVVRLAIRYADFPQSLEQMSRYSLFSPLQAGKDLSLQGFAQKTVYHRKTFRRPGELIIELELPPPARPGTPVSLEIRELRIHDVQTQHILTFRGPWTFTFTPQSVGPTETTRRVLLDRTLVSGPVRLQITDVVLSGTETMVTYRFTSETQGSAQMLGGPHMQCDGRSYPGDDAGTTVDGWQRVRFPVSPSDIDACRVVFGPFLVFDPTDIRFTLHWTNLVQGGETVRVREYAWHFEPPSIMQDRTELAYTPANDAAGRLLLVTSMDTVRVTDEAGNVYPVMSWRTEFTPTLEAVKRQVLYLDGLQQPVEQLQFHISQVGRIVEAVAAPLTGP